jgi:hypothetical protein
MLREALAGRENARRCRETGAFRGGGALSGAHSTAHHLSLAGQHRTDAVWQLGAREAQQIFDGKPTRWRGNSALRNAGKTPRTRGCSLHA